MKAKDKVKKGAADTGGIRKGIAVKRRTKKNPIKGGKIVGNWQDRNKKEK